MLRNAGLERYIVALPPENDRLEMLASEFAALHNAIRAYFGSGARGFLNRVGRSVWQAFWKDASLWQYLGMFVLRPFPPLQRGRFALNILASQMRRPDGQVSVHLLDKDLIFMDTTSDSTFGQTSPESVCWGTLGMIQAALYQATGKEQDVEEISCRAAGSVACRFRIRFTTDD